jgi:quercetin dioxygenase-like cupin family protein
MNMKVVRKADAQKTVGDGPQAAHEVSWIEGPHTSDRLDVGIVNAQPGGASPPHVHLGGQVMVVLEGRGFVETADGERVVMETGDIVIADPGEAHIHGALEDSHITHLTITTGQHSVPSAAPEDVAND